MQLWSSLEEGQRGQRGQPFAMPSILRATCRQRPRLYFAMPTILQDSLFDPHCSFIGVPLCVCHTGRTSVAFATYIYALSSATLFLHVLFD